MKFSRFMTAAATLATLALHGHASAADPSLMRVILVGDSTMASKSGYGDAFCARFSPAVDCVNLARGGRSTSSFRAEGRWDEVQRLLKDGANYKATYVLVQFGHNDQPGKPGRSTDLATEFPANMKRYVEEARSAGAIPVLVTPLTRRQFKNGRLEEDLAPWAEAIRRVAAETGTPLVDLNADSASAVQAMGPIAAMRLAQAPPSAQVLAAGRSGTTIAASTGAPPAPPPPPPRAPDAMAANNPAFDYTHLGREGADYFAEMVTRSLATAVPKLRPVLIP